LRHCHGRHDELRRADAHSSEPSWARKTFNANCETQVQ
jgi:hypothetical protein